MRLALAPLNPTIGDIAGNAALIASAAANAKAAGAHTLLCPELALCGYPPKDLLQHEGFLDQCAQAAHTLGTSASSGLTLIFGLPRATATGITNALAVYRDGALIATYDKQLLPTYDVFDEDRYFTPGAAPVVITEPTTGTRIGLTICEDLWKGDDAGFSSRYRDQPDPVPPLIAAGASLILSASASPFVIGKHTKHRTILASHARAHNVAVASVNQLGGNDDLIFDGHACVMAPGGAVASAAPLFAGGLHIVDIPAPHASVSKQEPSDESLLYSALVLGVRDYLRKTGFSSAILGLSGGIDSALTAVLAAAALGPANVTGLALPSHYSSDHSIADALDLARNLGIRCDVVPIEPAFRALGTSLDAAFAARSLQTLGARLPDITEENLQSRIRGTILMAFSNRSGAMVLTTGNKSELGVGYCTLYGDMNGGLAVLSDVTKQWVYRLSRWINANAASLGFSVPPIPVRSIDKPPSAELRPDQKDQDSLPPYDVLDEILSRAVEGRQSAARIVRETGFDDATVRRILRLVAINEYKRRQAAIGLKVTTVAFGSGRRWPVAQRFREA